MPQPFAPAKRRTRYFTRSPAGSTPSSAGLLHQWRSNSVCLPSVLRARRYRDRTPGRRCQRVRLHATGRSRARHTRAARPRPRPRGTCCLASPQTVVAGPAEHSTSRLLPAAGVTAPRRRGQAVPAHAAGEPFPAVTVWSPNIHCHAAGSRFPEKRGPPLPPAAPTSVLRPVCVSPAPLWSIRP